MIYRGRKIRGGLIRGTEKMKTIRVKVDDKESEESEDEEMDISDNSEKDQINEEEKIIGKKKKRTQKI